MSERKLNIMLGIKALIIKKIEKLNNKIRVGFRKFSVSIILYGIVNYQITMLWF